MESSDEGETKKISFSIDVGGGKKLRLIDISKEDDYLIASPLFDSLEDLRLSVTLDSTNGHENLHSSRFETSLAAQNAAELVQPKSEQKLFSSAAVEPGRPSYLRKSLAWDSAFFTNAGVLDPDELLLVNKGLKSRPLRGIQEDVHMWRSESGSSVCGEGLEGFEGDPFEDVRASIHRSSKMFSVVDANSASASRRTGLKNVRASKKVDSHSRVKLIPAFGRQSIAAQPTEKSKLKIAKSGEQNILRLKPPKVSGQMTGIPTGKAEMALTGRKRDQVIIEDKSAGKRSVAAVQSLMICKKFSPSVSSAVYENSNLSCSSYDSPEKAVSPDVPSNHLKRKTGSRKSKLSTSVSTSNTPLRYSAKNKRPGGNPSHSTQSLSISNRSSGQFPASSTGWSLVPSRKRECHDSKSDLDINTRAQRKCPENESRRASDLQGNLQCQPCFCDEREVSSPLVLNKAYGAGASGSVESFKQSGLRKPSPKIGFFDEHKPVMRKVRGTLQLQLKLQSASPKKREATSRKTPQELTELETAETESLNHVSQESKIQHPDSRIQPRHVPDGASNRYTDSRKGMESGSCFKSRKTGAGEHDRKRNVQSSSVRGEERKRQGISSNKLIKDSKRQKAKANVRHSRQSQEKFSSKTGAQVDELSKVLEGIDLNREIVMDSYSSSARTPLGDKTSVCNNTSETYEVSMDSTKEKAADKHQVLNPFREIDKENS